MTRYNIFHADLITRAIQDENISVEEFEGGCITIDAAEFINEDEFVPKGWKETTKFEKRMQETKKIIPKRCTHPICHCTDGVDTIDCWAFLNERFKECPYANCECYKR